MDELSWLLFSWVVAGIALLLALRRRKTISVGLPIAYFMGIFIINWPGAALYLIPGYVYYKPEVVMEGFRLTTYGMWAFVLGTLLGGFKQAWGGLSIGANHVKGIADTSRINRTAKFFLVAGLVIQLVLMPLIGGVATLTAIISGLGGLSIVGACLGIRGAQLRRDKKRFRAWMLVAFMFPFITLTSSAFVGFGVHSLIVVLAFILMLTRTGPVRIVLVLLAIYLGISFYVTYMRDRHEIREAIWYEQVDYTDRLKQVSKIFIDFEFFSTGNDEHLRAVDKRLNQNWLVGSAMEYISLGNKPYANGETILAALVAMVPRVVWPDKPEIGGGGSLVTDYTGMIFSRNTSVGAGQVFEFYINFGTMGVVIGFILLGAAMRQFDARAARALHLHDYRHFLIWFLPGFGFLQAGGNLIEVTTSVGAGIGGALLVSKLLERQLQRRKSRKAHLTQEWRPPKT